MWRDDLNSTEASVRGGGTVEGGNSTREGGTGTFESQQSVSRGVFWETSESPVDAVERMIMPNQGQGLAEVISRPFPGGVMSQESGGGGLSRASCAVFRSIPEHWCTYPGKNEGRCGPL